MTEKEFKELLDRYSKGITTLEEEKLLSKFEKFSIDNQEENFFKSDIEKYQIKKEIYGGIKSKRRRKPRVWMKVAAAIVILITTSVFLTRNKFGVNDDFTTYANTIEHAKKVELVDGSIVHLAKDSKIQYDNNHDGTRYAILDGEAFFDIARNEQKPFIIKTGDVQTKVLGTSFNITENDNEVNVVVATGLVEVSDSKKSVQLKPNQRTKYQFKNANFNTTSVNHNLFTFWYKNTIRLDSIIMRELADFITYKYDHIIEFKNEKAKENRMTINLNNEDSIETLIENINFINELILTKTTENMIEVTLQ